MIAVYFVLYLVAVLCFALSAMRVVHRHFDFLPVGLVFMTSVPLIQMFLKL